MPTSCIFFFGNRSRKNSKVKRAWPGVISRWVTDRELFPGAHEWGQSAQKRYVLVCEDILCPRKLPDVSGPGLGEAGRYRIVSEPTLAVSRARTGVSARTYGRACGGADATGMWTGA